MDVTAPQVIHTRSLEGFDELTLYDEGRSTSDSIVNEPSKSGPSVSRFEAPPLPRQPLGYQPSRTDDPSRLRPPQPATFAAIQANARLLASRENPNPAAPATLQTWEPPKQVDPLRLPPQAWLLTAGEAGAVFKKNSKAPRYPEITEESTETPKPLGNTDNLETSPNTAKVESGAYVPPHLRGLVPCAELDYVAKEQEAKPAAEMKDTPAADGKPVQDSESPNELSPVPELPHGNGANQDDKAPTNAKTNAKHDVQAHQVYEHDGSPQSGVPIDSDQTWEAVEGATGIVSPDDQHRKLKATTTCNSQKVKGKAKVDREHRSFQDTLDDQGWDEVQVFQRQDVDNDIAILADWDGTLAPAPWDWEHRPLYISKHQQNQDKIRKWSASANPSNVNINSPAFTSGAALATGEESVGAIIDAQAHETKPYDDPFTNIKGKITTEEAREKYAEKLEKAKVEQGQRFGEEKQKARLTKEERKAWRAALRKQDQEAASRPRHNAPRANIYLRPAESKDLVYVKAIYDHYVRESTVAPERDEVAIGTWQARHTDILAENHPFIVAMKRGRSGGDGNKRREGADRIVGFALAEDVGVKNSSYRLTCETHVYVSHTETRQDIGDCLLDRLLACLEIMYAPRRRVEWKGNQTGCDYRSRDHKIISMNFPYAKQSEGVKLEWVKGWLEKYDFELTGTLPGYGYKHKQR